MTGEPQEKIGVEIVVTDSGTPVVKRHTEETRRALGEVERASRTSSAAVTGGMQKAGAATEGLGQTMEKSRAAAMALAGGMSQAGGRAAQAASAISMLVVTGLNPLGLALAAASVGIGLLVAKHAEGAEAAKKHAEAIRSIGDAASEIKTRLSAGMAGVPVDLFTVRENLRRAEEELAFRIQQFDERKERGRLFVSSPSPFRGQEGTEGFVATEEGFLAQKKLVDALRGLEQQMDTANRRASQRVATGGTGPGGAAGDLGGLAALHTRWIAEEAQFLTDAEERVRLFRERRAKDALSEGQRTAAGLIGGFQPPALPTVGGDRVGGFNEGNLGVGSAAMPFETDFDPREQWERWAKEMNARDPWFQAGTRAGDAMAEGISDSLSTAVLSGRFDLAELGKSMGEMLVRTFMDALVQASVGDQLRVGFQSLFMSLGGVFGGTGGGGGGETPQFTPSSVGTRGPAPLMVVEVAPAPVVGERVLASASDEFVRARVSFAYANQGTPGRRA